jgi:RsiW-degrading membrane proteinase PrsW (M82 family)
MMLFLLLLAILPVILLLFFIYAKDSYEKEPIKLLIGLVVLGIVSAIPAIILEEVLQSMIDPIFGVPKKAPTYAYHFIIAFLGVAVVEEFVKFMAAFFPTWNHPAFNFKFDGIVYCFYASMGFALIENILYIFGNATFLTATM